VVRERRGAGGRSSRIEPVEPVFPFTVGVEQCLDPKLCRMFLVERGALRLQWPEGVLTLLPGSLALIPPGLECRILRGPDALLRGFAFAGSLVDPLTLDRSGDAVYEEMGLAGPGGRGPSAPRAERLAPAEYRDAASLFALLQREASERKPGFEPMVRLRLMEALLLLYRARHESGRHGASAPLRFSLAEVERFIQERYAEELSLPGIAARYGLNPSYFSRLFHREAGIPLVAYINRVRIQRSCLLLKRTRMSILEISLSVGYNNLSHFNRYFRRIVGTSPREYRLSAER
jgi:AraC-like DNA-binding protein